MSQAKRAPAITLSTGDLATGYVVVGIVGTARVVRVTWVVRAMLVMTEATPLL
jgi:hypothetical protein